MIHADYITREDLVEAMKIAFLEGQTQSRLSDNHQAPTSKDIIKDSVVVATASPEKTTGINNLRTGMCKCGAGPFTSDEMRSHNAKNVRKGIKGVHGFAEGVKDVAEHG